LSPAVRYPGSPLFSFSLLTSSAHSILVTYRLLAYKYALSSLVEDQATVARFPFPSLSCALSLARPTRRRIQACCAIKSSFGSVLFFRCLALVLAVVRPHRRLRPHRCHLHLARTARSRQFENVASALIYLLINSGFNSERQL
jgi:hypothetical protein